LGGKYGREGCSEFHCANFADPNLKIVLRASDERAWRMLHEAGIRCASPKARDPGKFVRDVVVICSLGKLRRYTESPVAFIEVAAAFYIFIVGRKLTVVCAAGAVGPGASFEAITGMHFFQSAFWILGNGVTIARVNWEAVRGVAYHCRPTTAAIQPLDQPGRQAVIVIRAGGLDMGVIFVEAEIDEAGFGFVVPSRARIVIPEFSGAGVEGDAIQSDAEKGMSDWCGIRSDFRVGGQMKGVVLGRDGVWISGSWKVAGLMIGPTVGANDPFTAGYGDGHAIGADACLDTICVGPGAELAR